MMFAWTQQQWTQLHQAIAQPADKDLLQAIIEGAGLLEPSDWPEAMSQLAPWQHITSLFINVASTGGDDVGIFIQQMKRYIPRDAMIKATLWTLVQTLSDSVEHTGSTREQWNGLLRVLGVDSLHDYDDENAIGDWSL